VSGFSMGSEGVLGVGVDDEVVVPDVRWVASPRGSVEAGPTGSDVL
jgi:hypothetical protein